MVICSFLIMVSEIPLNEGLYYLSLSFSGSRFHDPNGEPHTHAEFMGILNRTSTSTGKNNSVGNFWCGLIQLLGTARYWRSFTSHHVWLAYLLMYVYHFSLFLSFFFHFTEIKIFLLIFLKENKELKLLFFFNNNNNSQSADLAGSGY